MGRASARALFVRGDPCEVIRARPALGGGSGAEGDRLTVRTAKEMITKKSRNLARQKRHLRIRSRLRGSGERPRLSVFRSLKHMYAQVIDDTDGRTLAAASTLDPSLRDALPGTPKVEEAARVGRLVAERAHAAGVRQVAFDRGGYLYHGRVQRLAEAAREAGLVF